MSDVIRDLLARSPEEPVSVVVEGWVRTSRFSKSVSFVHVTDGSCVETIQVVIHPPASPELKTKLTTGASVRISGGFVSSIGPGQPSEIKTSEGFVEIIGECDASLYPIQKKEASPEFYRTIPHLRVRTVEFQRIFRARSTLAISIHDFLDSLGFLWTHTPIISFSDCEGAGEAFR